MNGLRCILILALGLIAVSDARAETDLTPLFAEPTAEEVALVRADWGLRPVHADQFTHEREAVVSGYTMTRASFVYEGLVQYGLVRFPLHFSPDGSFPVLVLHHGGEQGLYYMDGVQFDETYPTGCLADSSFVLMPTYRGEAFAGSSALGNRFSQGEPSLWDRDCDDAMAMLTAFLAATPSADPGRITSLGRSRGATVAYHMAVRDPRVRRSVILFGASNFLHEDIQTDCDLEVNGGIAATNTLSKKVMAEIVNPWLAGESSLAEARLLLTGWSIINFLDGGLAIQLHHGQLDTNIPIAHSLLVRDLMLAMGAGSPNFDFFSYPLAGHNTAGMTGYEERVEGYLCHLQDQNLSATGLPGAQWQISAWPNPFTDRVHLAAKSFPIAAPSPTLRIYDLRGRLVRALAAPVRQSGEFQWDGLDQQGQEAPAGVYLIAPVTLFDSATTTSRIIKLR